MAPPTKKPQNQWDPTGYFWTHGYKIRVSHSSDTCTKRKDGHNAYLTDKRRDIKGGWEWNRTWNTRAN